MKTFGLIGFPLKQSFSQKYFTEKFVNLSLSAQYLNFSIPTINDLPSILAANPTIEGFNVTIPYKKDVIKFLHEMDETAKSIGAVNVVKVRYENNKPILKGYNSDIIGFENSLKKYITSNHTNALILGTGGASLAVEFALKRLGIEYIFVSRKALDEKTISYSQLDRKTIEKHKLIINTTPLGMFPEIDFAPELPYNELSSEHLLYDLVYNPPITKFMELGAKYGAKTVNGLEMLHGQAEEAWRIWNNQ